MNKTSWLRASLAHQPQQGLRFLAGVESLAKVNGSRLGRISSTAAMLAVLGLGTTLSLARDNGDDDHDNRPGHYQPTNLVSDVPGLAAATDPNLVNAWGLSTSTAGPWWVSDNGTGLTTLYSGTGAVQTLVVTVPALPGATAPSAPTGQVFSSSTTDFLVAPTKPSHFIFATEEGTISGWNGGPNAVLMVNNAGRAVYKGLALAQRSGANFLYAANFQTGRIDVFDREFKPVDLGAEAFRDPRLPDDFAPFNVQAIGGMIYVTFAQKEADSIDEVHGPGRGFVEAFSTDGVLQRRLQWGPWFNAPWGVALAPAGFGRFSNLLLVAQFGSGKIAAFDPESGEFRGIMRGEHGAPVIIDGIWALAFGNDGAAGPSTTLFFTAGNDDEAHGLFGSILPVADSDDDEHQGGGNGRGSDNGRGGDDGNDGQSSGRGSRRG